jgi:hypothetical protein
MGVSALPKQLNKRGLYDCTVNSKWSSVVKRVDCMASDSYPAALTPSPTWIPEPWWMSL